MKEHLLSGDKPHAQTLDR